MTSASLHFRVRSASSDEIYDVKADFEPRLKITCTCQAGLIGSVCKHRTALLLGDVTSVVEVKADDVENLARKAAEAPLGAAMRDLVDLEASADRLKREINGKKKQIARLMDGR